MTMFGGMLAGAIGGGAQAADQIATSEIEKQQRLDYAKQISQMEEEKARRLAEFQEQQRRSGALWDKTGEGGEASRTALGKELAIKSDANVAEQVKLGPVAAKNAALAATATADAAAEEAKKHAADPTYIAAVSKLKLADPEVAARIAQAKAAINASNAHAGMLAVQTAGLKLDVEDKKKLNGLYDQASDILTDADMNDTDRAKALGKVQQQITLIKSKTGQTGAKDPELDTVTTEKTTTDDKGNTTKTTTKEVRRPGRGGDEKAPYADGTELRGKDGKLYVVQGGQPVLKEAAAAPAPKKEGGMLGTAPASQPPELSATDKGIQQDLQPLADQYQQAKAQLQAVGRSGDQQAIQRYTQQVNELGAQLRREAESRLGNGAQRFLSTVL